MDVLGRGCNGREIEPIDLLRARGSVPSEGGTADRSTGSLVSDRDWRTCHTSTTQGGLFGLAFRVLGAFGSGLLAGFAL
jgi:hypothetical protein